MASYSGCNNSSSQQAFHRESAKSGAEKDVRSRSALPIFLGLCVEMNHSPAPLSLSLPTSPALLFLPFFFCFFFPFCNIPSPRPFHVIFGSCCLLQSFLRQSGCGSGGEGTRGCLTIVFPFSFPFTEVDGNRRYVSFSADSNPRARGKRC